MGTARQVVASKYYTLSVQTYVATAAMVTKSGHVMALKVIMTVEVAGLKSYPKQ